MTYRAARHVRTLALCLTLLSMGCVTTSNRCLRGTLGIEPDDISREFRETHQLPKEMQGSVVAIAIEGGPAAAAGVRGGDVLLEVRAKPITNSCDATNALFDGRCDPVTVVVWRDGARQTVTMTPVPEQTFLRQKCNEGVAAACFRLGWLLWSGTGVPADEWRGVRMVRNACDKGWAEACASLGFHLMDSNAADSDIVKTLTRACELGSSAGCAHLAYLYASGTGVDRDDARATPLYVRACDLGDSLGCYNVGLIYNSGRGVDKDPACAIAAYEEGCRGGSSSACTDLGWYYEHGEGGVAKDASRATGLYKKGCDGSSCQAPNLRGCVKLALAYRDGIGVAADPDQAAELLRSTCINDVDTDDPNAQENRSHACSLLGGMYLTGRGVEVNYGAGLTLSDRGCEGGDSFGCFNAAVVFTNGLGVDADMTEAAEYYERACDYDDGESCYDLSLLYREGNGVETDTERATELSQQACDLGFEAACSEVK